MSNGITTAEALRLKYVRDQLEAMEGLREVVLSFPGLDRHRWADALVPLTDRLLRELGALEDGAYKAFLEGDDDFPSELERTGSNAEKWLENGILADYGLGKQTLEAVGPFPILEEIRYPQKPPMVDAEGGLPICPRCGRRDVFERPARLDPEHLECSAVCCGFKWQPNARVRK